MGGIEAATTVLALGSSDGKSGFGRGRDILRHLDWDFFIFYFDLIIYAISVTKEHFHVKLHDIPGRFHAFQCYCSMIVHIDQVFISFRDMSTFKAGKIACIILKECHFQK